MVGWERSWCQDFWRTGKCRSATCTYTHVDRKTGGKPTVAAVVKQACDAAWGTKFWKSGKCGNPGTCTKLHVTDVSGAKVAVRSPAVHGSVGLLGAAAVAGESDASSAAWPPPFHPTNGSKVIGVDPPTRKGP